MQIFTICKLPDLYMRLKKILIIMKLTTLLLVVGCMHLNATVFSQKISLSERNQTLETVFKKLEAQSGYAFFYETELIEAMPKVSISIKDLTLDEALKGFIEKLSLTYSIVGKTVVIKSSSVSRDAHKNSLKIYVGKVLNEKDQAMPGVSVRIKGTNLVFVTNQEGQFITSPITDTKAILQFSYMGYLSQEIPVSTLTNPVVIKMNIVSSDLDQVQITAYGTTTKRLATGNITTITAEDIAKHPARNVLEIIQGQVPGLFVQQLSGLPGSPFNLVIRGQQTMTGGFRSSQPLIIVDGVALPSGALPLNQNGAALRENMSSELKGGNPLDYIDPANIESVTVLKDADATAIYGSRGAYGVILITMKKGRAGVPKLNFNATSGVSVRGISPELLNTQQYVMLRTEAYKNDGIPITNAPTFNDINGPNAGRYNDFQDELAGNTAQVNRFNATYSGGTSDINFLIGGNFRRQTSIQMGKGSVRDGGLNFNLNNSVKDGKFKVSLSGSLLSTTDDAVPYDFSQSSAVTTAPNAGPLFLEDGSLNWIDYPSNPASAMNIIYKNITNNFFTNLGLVYMPVKGLSLNANIGYNNINAKILRAQPSTYYQPGSAYRTTSNLSLYNIRNITIEPNMSYKTSLFKKGMITLQAGGTLQNQLRYETSTTGNDFLSDEMLYNPTFADQLTSAGAVNITTSYDQVPNKYIGFFGILNYNWDQKYILNVNVRRDGSTKFGPNNQYGNFGSVGAAWIISSENWLKGMSRVLSFAKLRASLGTSGGDGIGNYGYLTTYMRTTSYQGGLSIQSNNLANANLHWEKNRKAEGGLTMEFLTGRIYTDISYYESRTTDQLISQQLPSTTGFTARSLNSPAVIRNYGWEFDFNTKNITGNNFRWSSHFNLTLPKNKLVAYPGLGTTIVDNVNYVIGKPVQGIRVYNYVGVDPQTGLYNFKDRNGVIGTFRQLVDPVALDVNLDKTEFIDLTPKFYGGVGNTFSYKNLSLDIFFLVTRRNGKTLLGSQSYAVGFPGSNLSTIALTRWQNPGDITGVPRAGAGLSSFSAQNNFTNSTGAYGDATYGRLQSLNISYALQEGLLKQLHLNALSVFAQGSNLLTISKYKDLDPENLGAGMAPLRSFTAGLRITL